MAIYNNISSKVIIRKVLRDLKPGNADWIDDAVEWVGEALEHIGASSQLEKKQCVLTIKDHKAVLPADLYFINQVAVNSSVSANLSSELDTLVSQVKALKSTIQQYNQTLESEIVLSTNGTYTSNITKDDLEVYDTQYKSNILELREINSRIIVLENAYFSTTPGTLTPLSYGASTFHKSMHCEDCINEISTYKETYIIDNGYVKTSFESGKICVSYAAFPIDEECYPLVPNDISFKEALFWYIYKQLLLGGFDKPNNKIDYNFADQKWRFYCGQAQAAANFPDIDKMESFMNQWVRLIPQMDRHSLFFEHLNDRERI